MIEKIISMFNGFRNLITVRNCGIFLIACVILLPNIPLFTVGFRALFRIGQFDKVDAKIIDTYLIMTWYGDMHPLTEEEISNLSIRESSYTVKMIRVEYYANGEYKHRNLLCYYTDQVGEKIPVFINRSTGTMVSRASFIFNYADPLFILGVMFFLISQFFELGWKKEYKNYRNAKMALKIQKEIDLEEVIGKRTTNIINDETYFDKLCLKNLQRSIPTEINWILCKGDLSRFDNSFLWKQDEKTYEIFSETLRLQREGLSQDYIVFQITGDMCFAINFDDNQVYSFVMDKFEEPLLQGNFLHYLENFFQDNK